MNDEEKQILSEIINALYSQGYQPYNQIYGYVKTGNELYWKCQYMCSRKIPKFLIISHASTAVTTKN